MDFFVEIAFDVESHMLILCNQFILMIVINRCLGEPGHRSALI